MLAAGVGVFWWLGRGASGPTGPLANEVVRRATDMNDPDGTFMDGYVAGRLTERAEARKAIAQRRPHADAVEPDRVHLDDDGVDDWGPHADVHSEGYDDDW